MRRWNGLVLATLFLLVSTSGCIVGFAGIRGSGNLVTVDQEIADFDSLRVGYGCRLTLTQSNNFRVTIRIDDNLRDFLKIERKGSLLEIGLESGRNYQRIHFEADIQMPDLKDLRLSGGTRGLFDRFTLNHDLSIRLSGGSRIEGIVEADHLEIGASGGAEADLEGLADTLDVKGSGGSQIWLRNLEAGAVAVDLSGGSQSTINLDGPLTGRLSGGSTVRYAGDPSQIQVSRSGGARIVRQ